METTMQPATNMFEARDNWLKQRLGKFTASEINKLLKGGTRPMTAEELDEAKNQKSKRTTVDVLFGDGATTYMEEILAEIITMQAKEDISTIKALEWGASQEHEAVEVFTEWVKSKKGDGVKVDYYGIAEPRFMKYTDFSGGSPDGLVHLSMLLKSILEMKCPYVSSKHMRFLRASLNGASNEWLKKNNEDYYCQVQFNMMSATKELGIDVTHGFFCSYDPRPLDAKHRLAVIEIYQDKEYQQDIDYRLNKAAEKLVDDLTLFG